MKSIEMAGFIWIMLIFTAPVGMFVLWKNDKHCKRVRIVLSLVNAFWLIFAAIIGSTL